MTKEQMKGAEKVTPQRKAEINRAVKKAVKQYRKTFDSLART